MLKPLLQALNLKPSALDSSFRGHRTAAAALMEDGVQDATALRRVLLNHRTSGFGILA